MPSFSDGSHGRLFCNGTDLSPYFKTVTTNGDVDTADTSALGDTYKTIITGQAGADLSAEGMHDDSAGAVVSVLDAARTDTATEIVHFLNTDVVGNLGIGMQGAETAFDVTTPVADVAAVSLGAQSDTAFESVVALTAKADAFTSGSVNGAAVDNGAATTAGASGYEHAFDYGGAGTLTCKIQHSTSGTAGWADLINFAAVSAAHQSERAVTAAGATVNRYLRAVIVKTGAGTASVSVSCSRTPYL